MHRKMSQGKEKTPGAYLWGRQIPSLPGLSHFATVKYTQHIQVPGSSLSAQTGLQTCLTGISKSFNINFSTTIIHTSFNLQGNISLQRYLHKGLSHFLVIGRETSIRPSLKQHAMIYPAVTTLSVIKRQKLVYF